MTRANNAPWFTKAGAATGIMPLSQFVGESIFALKGGGYGCLFSVVGIDEESRTDEDLDVRVRGVEASLRGLPPDSYLYQYTRLWLGSLFRGRRSMQIQSPNRLLATASGF